MRRHPRLRRVIQAVPPGPNCGSKNPRLTLGTITVRVKDRRGQMVIARALVDEGNDTSLESAAFIHKLGFSERKMSLRIH